MDGPLWVPAPPSVPPDVLALRNTDTARPELAVDFSGGGTWRVQALKTWLLLAGLTFLTGCGGPATPPVTLRIGIFAVQDLLPYFVIREQGFDRANGLRFEEQTFAGGAAAIDAMAAGSIDMSPVVGSVPILVAAERGLIPGKIVPAAANDFADPDHPGVGVVAANSSAGWKGLRGKKIAINARNSVTTAAVAGRLKLEGVDDYSLVEIPFPNMGLAVAGGNVAAAGMNEPFLTQSLLRGDGQLLGWVVGGPPLERAPMTSIVFRGDFLRSNPQVVKAYLRAHIRAVRWMAKSPEAARSILAHRLSLPVEIGRRLHLLRWPADARHDPALLEKMLPMLFDVGVLRGSLEVRKTFDETILGQVLAEMR